MKTLNPIQIAAVIAATFILAGTANAQYRVNEDDGIAASPRVREVLNERKARNHSPATLPSSAVTVAAADRRGSGVIAITAPPRTLEQLAERRTSTVASAPVSQVAAAGYRPTGADGITASPKLREQLSERRGTIMVAPVK